MPFEFVGAIFAKREMAVPQVVTVGAGAAHRLSSPSSLVAHAYKMC